MGSRLMSYSGVLSTPTPSLLGYCSLTQLAAKRLVDIDFLPLRPLLLISRKRRNGGRSLFCEAKNDILFRCTFTNLFICPYFVLCRHFLKWKKPILLVVKLVNFESNSKWVIGVFSSLNFSNLGWYGVWCLTHVCYPPTPLFWSLTVVLQNQ